ncbi:MAG: hypothetical protein COB76_06005 [Alphaproteobacteria bacterium]|nr:MAG: hypothetical protein COB76_06005 [Alphaproteobacteria bacterium]
MKSIASLLFGLIISIHVPVAAHETGLDNAGFCQKAQATSDLVACSTQHLKAQNDHLKALYDELADAHKDNTIKLEQLNTHQNEWFNFRTQTCGDESALYEGESLSHIQKITCQARMASGRSKHLTTMLATMNDREIPVFSSPPRWTNVLIHDFKDIFWAFSDTYLADTDCDGVDETIVKGVKEDVTGAYSHVTAIADSDKTGRPVIHVLNFSEEKDCEISSDLVMTPAPAFKPIEGADSPDNQCTQIITVQTKQCGSFVLSLDEGGNSYKVMAKNDENKERKGD